MLPENTRRQARNALLGAAPVLPERGRIMAALQLNEHFLPRLIFQTLQILDRQSLDGFDFVLRKVWPLQYVGVEFQGGAQISGEGGSPKPNVQCPNALIAIQTEIIQSEAE